jgi:hypothetical protein
MSVRSGEGIRQGRSRRLRRGPALKLELLPTAAEDLARACAEEGRFEFMVVGLPLRLPGGTGSPWNPIAIF